MEDDQELSAGNNLELSGYLLFLLPVGYQSIFLIFKHVFIYVCVHVCVAMP